MKKVYTKPNVEVVSLKTNNVITLSGDKNYQTVNDLPKTTLEYY